MTETDHDCSPEVKETETEMAEFFKKGVTMMAREGEPPLPPLPSPEDSLRLSVGDSSLLFSVDKRCQQLLARQTGEHKQAEAGI